MSNTSWANSRVGIRCHRARVACAAMPFVAFAAAAQTAVVTAYKPLGNARNDAQGGASAWSPPD